MPNQPKKYRVLLRPLGDSKLRYDLRHARRMLRYAQRTGEGQADALHIERLEKQLEDQITNLAPRVIDGDCVKVIDDGSMLIGIEPGNRVLVASRARAGRNHAKGLKIRRTNPEFYDIKHTPPGRKPNDPSHTDYIVTRKFRKILSINIDNVISINGKPVMGRLDNLDQGVRHLGLDEDWSVDNVSDLLDE